MKYILPLLFIIACTGGNKLKKEIEANTEQTHEPTSTISKTIYWKGSINKTIDILLKYQLEDSIIFGSITYLNTKEKIPLRIIGRIERDGSYRIFEFEKNGQKPGMITGEINDNSFSGMWHSAKSTLEWPVELKKLSTNSAAENIEVEKEQIVGRYHYKVGVNGSEGNLVVTKINSEKYLLSIFCVTSAPSYHVAQLDSAIIDAKTDQVYRLKAEYLENCSFRFRFFKEFVYVNHQTGDCDLAFGNGASIAGIYYRVKNKQ